MRLSNFKDKRFRYGTFSTAMMLFAVLLFVLVNLLAGEFNRTWDLTDEELFTLSQPSRNFLAELDQDITLTLIASTGEGSPILMALVDEYANASSRITADFRDPMLNPAFVQGFTSGLEGGFIPNDSVIVQSGAQYRVITPDMMATIQRDMWGNPVAIISLNFERQITTAIHSIIQGEIAVVYKVLGSGEFPLGQGITEFLETENFIVRELDAMTIIRDGIPADADILLLSTPQRDWPTEKADRILAFLENEGRAFFAMEPVWGERMPNVDRVLASYGIRISDYFIMETDPRQHFVTPAFMLPQLWPHEVNLPLAAEGRFNLFLRYSAAIELLEMHRASTSFNPLLHSSMQAFGRSDPMLESALYHEGIDHDGPFFVGIAVMDSIFTDRNVNTYLVVVGSGDIWGEAPRELIGDNNFAFVASSLRWLMGQGPGLFIPTRTPPGMAPLTVNQFQANMIAGFSMGILPLATLAAGMFVWYRRRHS
jgi:ABC-2 type transport system permease protein